MHEWEKYQWKYNFKNTIISLIRKGGLNIKGKIQSTSESWMSTRENKVNKSNNKMHNKISNAKLQFKPQWSFPDHSVLKLLALSQLSHEGISRDFFYSVDG